jgi:hypothetical protein
MADPIRLSRSALAATHAGCFGRFGVALESEKQANNTCCFGSSRRGRGR